MATIRRSPNSSVLIYERDTPAGRRVYPTVWAERIRRTSLSTWERRVVNGAPTADAEEFISSWTQDDYSGGIGIEDANEGTDGSRVRFAFMDLRSPKHVVHAPKTLRPAKPSWATGDAMPLGDIVSNYGTDDARFYMAWGSHASGWKEDTLSYSETDNNLVRTPRGPGAQFMGWLFVPCMDGFLALRQSNDSTQTLLLTETSTAFVPICFGTWNNNLWAIDTTNRLWQISALSVETTRTTIGSPTGWEKKQFNSADLVLDRSHVPTRMANFFNREGKETFWVITNKGAFLFGFDGPEWVQSTISPSMHPDFGQGAVPWRTGEDLYVGAGGLDISRFTAGSIDVPMMGPGKDQGCPPQYNGTIVDLAAERSTLYALIKGLPPVISQTIDDSEGAGQETAYLATPTTAMWLAAWTGQAWCCLSQDADTTGVPTRLFVSTAKGSYRLHWGGTDGQARSQKIPLAFYNPRTKIQLQVDPFELTGFIETVRYDANMTGWDKIASHCFAMTDWAQFVPDPADETRPLPNMGQYINVSYRTDADIPQGTPLSDAVFEPEWHPWKRIDKAGRTMLWFDDDQVDPQTGLPWREGLPFQWIQFRFDGVTNDEMVSPIWHSFSMHHIRVPQDAASYVVKVPFFEGPASRGFGKRSGQEMAQTLREMQRLRKMIHFQPNNYESFRGRIVGISEEAWPGGENFSSVMVLNFVEIGASSNLNQAVA